MSSSVFPVPLSGIQESIIAAKGDLIVGTANDTPGILSVGTDGHILVADSSVSPTGLKWATPSDQTPLTTKGDLFTFSTVDARLGVGANNTVLTADSAEATGLKWATPAGGGKVLQVVQGTTSTAATVTSNTTFLDTNLTATITPSSASSKVLIMTSQDLFKEAQTNSAINYRLLRGSTAIVDYPNAGILFQDTAIRLEVLQTIVYLDSPNTTSATTYKTQFKNYLSGGTAVAQGDSNRSSFIILMEIGA